MTAYQSEGITASNKKYTMREAVAEAMASMDGKLNQFRDENDESGYREGYYSEAEELIDRIEKRGWMLSPRFHIYGS